MKIEVTEEEKKLVDDFRRDKKNDKFFEILLENYGKNINELAGIVYTIEEFMDEKHEREERFFRDFDCETFEALVEIFRNME